ncbi:MAG: hypothetical protein M1826_004019 [Phylliscum demangeonii]|nr:MAG: hypothetical protein M1826_004019 [Phylliscum demangeonii]
MLTVLSSAMHLAQLAAALSATLATLVRIVYLTPQLAVRVEPSCLAAHLPHNFCGLFGAAQDGDDDTGALREAFAKARPSTTTAPASTPTASIPPAGPSYSSEYGWEPVEEEGWAAPVVPERPKTTVTVTIRPDTPAITIQFADIAVKVIVEQLVAPGLCPGARLALLQARDGCGRCRSQASTGEGVAVLRKRRASDPGSWSVALRATRDGGISAARGQDEPLGDANWAPPPHLEGATPIAEPEPAPESPRVVADEAEGPLEPAVGMEEAPPASEGEPAVEGNSPAKPASQQVEPVDDFPPAEGAAAEEPCSSPLAGFLRASGSSRKRGRFGLWRASVRRVKASQEEASVRVAGAGEEGRRGSSWEGAMVSDGGWCVAVQKDCDGTPWPPAMTHGNGRWTVAPPDRAPLDMWSDTHQSRGRGDTALAAWLQAGWGRDLRSDPGHASLLPTVILLDASRDPPHAFERVSPRLSAGFDRNLRPGGAIPLCLSSAAP